MEIVLYAFTVMYTPGPVNLLSLNEGLSASLRETWGFFAGVALAIFCWFAVIGFAGQILIVQDLIPYIALAGSAYILYLGFKVFASTPTTAGDRGGLRSGRLSFSNGFFMQLLNPKNSLVVIPITTVMFPGREITGAALIGCSALIALGGGGAPALYFWAGKIVGKQIHQPRYFRLCNRIMAILLVLVAVMMFFDYVFIPLL